jgi:hypothetical protein
LLSTAGAAAQAVGEPTAANIDAVLSAAQQRARGNTFGSLPLRDEHDVAALVERLVASKRASASP